MKAFYNKYGFLERKHRDELIQTIVDYVVMKEIKLHCSDFAKIVDMIVNIFPTEDEARVSFRLTISNHYVNTLNKDINTDYQDEYRLK